MGRKHTPETKAKIQASVRRHLAEHPEIRLVLSERATGRTHSAETKNKIKKSLCTYWENHPEKKVSLSKLLVKYHSENPDVMCGAKNPAWKGGSPRNSYPYKFDFDLREKIRDRDNRICMVCKLPEQYFDRFLSVHHIDYDKENCEDSNLISLCVSCHSATNSNRKYWVERLSALL